MESDIALARHVTFVHQFKKNPELDFEPFDPKFLKLYISQVRCCVSWRLRWTSSRAALLLLYLRPPWLRFDRREAGQSVSTCGCSISLRVLPLAFGWVYLRETCT